MIELADIDFSKFQNQKLTIVQVAKSLGFRVITCAKSNDTLIKVLFRKPNSPLIMPWNWYDDPTGSYIEYSAIEIDGEFMYCAPLESCDLIFKVYKILCRCLLKKG